MEQVDGLSEDHRGVREPVARRLTHRGWIRARLFRYTVLALQRASRLWHHNNLPPGVSREAACVPQGARAGCFDRRGPEAWVSSELASRSRARKTPIWCAAPAAMSTTSTLAGQARAYVLRSPHAHARIRLDRRRRARAAMPGVRAGADRRRSGSCARSACSGRSIRASAATARPPFISPQPLLARERVRYVGDPVAFVVADTLAPGQGRRRG